MTTHEELMIRLACVCVAAILAYRNEPWIALFVAVLAVTGKC